ncbi:MAG: toll/interleukin-1 receptor domain-containing protein [Armatimonadetes bacterium]|nr:toll/interleukin-1 receptor domain-containing protein [Armatimonadota bacterium]
MKRGGTKNFELPRKMERILAALAHFYAESGKPSLQRLLVNSRYRVQEEWTYDGIDGGIYGHAVYFQVPPAIFHEIYNDLYSVGQQLGEGINRFKNIQDEYIHEVFIELEETPEVADWREQSGVLEKPGPALVTLSDDQLSRLWKPGFFRLFVSHKAEEKILASEFKTAMEGLGVSSFVAHEDIKPTKEWEDEIERALYSMEAMVAIMTSGFHDSEWTDQEIGVAIGRGVPVVSVRLGKDPYGLIGKYQALSGLGKESAVMARGVFDLLWEDSALRPRMVEGLVCRFEQARKYVEANELIKILETVESMPPTLIDRIESAPEKNLDVNRAYAVQNRLPGLLKRLRGRSSEVA